MLVVVGEPGIGKTALLEAAAERAGAAGLLTLAGRAAEHEREVPFALAVAALDDHVVHAAPAARRDARPGARRGPARRRERACAAPARRRRGRRSASATTARCASLLELLARERPLALLLDDLHWADDASIEFIQHLLRRPPRSPYLLVLALRAPSVLMEHRRAPQRHRVRLPRPARPRRVAGAAARGPRRRAARADRARGARQPVLPGPAHARRRGHAAAVRAWPRSTASWPRCRPARGRCSTAPPSPAIRSTPSWPRSPPSWRTWPRPLDQLVAAGVVHATGNGRGFAFRHPLVRRAVYDAAPPAWRLGAHERIAAALAERAARAPACARTTSRRSRGPATRRRSSC